MSGRHLDRDPGGTRACMPRAGLGLEAPCVVAGILGSFPQAPLVPSPPGLVCGPGRSWLCGGRRQQKA